MTNLTWQKQLADAITDPKVLCDALDLEIKTIADMQSVVRQFPLRVPRAFLSRMEKGNINDPLLQQVLPMGVEMYSAPGYFKDPLNESNMSPVPGLLHKYPGRVLLTLAGACAVHCRYCFRRNYPYTEKVPGVSQWQPALHYVAENTSIDEVILSGGDPLVLKDESLTQIIRSLEAIPHLKRLRIHTRLPIVIPARVTQSLVTLLDQSKLKVILVIHSNHVNELDDSIALALKKFQSTTLLNQAVLLQGINDTAESLINLSKRLFEIGVLPYYLHLLDPVIGTAHFEVSEKEAISLMQAISEQLPGYLVPKLVREIPGEKSKQIIC